MINYFLLAIVLMVVFAIIQLVQYQYIKNLVGKKSEEAEIRKVAFWGTVVSSITIGVGILLLVVVFVTRRYTFKEAALLPRKRPAAANAFKKPYKPKAPAPVQAGYVQAPKPAAPVRPELGVPQYQQFF